MCLWQLQFVYERSLHQKIIISSQIYSSLFPFPFVASSKFNFFQLKTFNEKHFKQKNDNKTNHKTILDTNHFRFVIQLVSMSTNRCHLNHFWLNANTRRQQNKTKNVVVAYITAFFLFFPWFLSETENDDECNFTSKQLNRNGDCLARLFDHFEVHLIWFYALRMIYSWKSHGKWLKKSLTHRCAIY